MSDVGIEGAYDQLEELGIPGPGPVIRTPMPEQSIPKDPWIHRSAVMSCATCMWYVQKAKAVGSINTAPIGRCRKHAPTMNGYPVVFETDWCGDHKLDENCN